MAIAHTLNKTRIQRIFKSAVFRWIWGSLSAVCILYTISRATDAIYYWSGTVNLTPDMKEAALRERTLKLPPSRLALAGIIAGFLEDDGVVDAQIWALAIARHIPTEDPGYVALVMGQIRRESHFNARDLEWLYDDVVPDMLHEARVINNPINTVGPMQINRHQLVRLMRQCGENVELAEGPKFSQLVADIDSGVRYAILYLDRIVVEHIPSRTLRGWPDYIGHLGIHPAQENNQPVMQNKEAFRLRETVAAYQKMLSDLLGDPLVLDGVFGKQTMSSARFFLATQCRPDDAAAMLEALLICSDTTDAEVMLSNEHFKYVCERWRQVYGSIPTLAIYPRISHDPRLVFIFADFNVGSNSSRVAAMQQMLNVLHDTQLDIDGKYGPQTLAAMSDYINRSPLFSEKRDDFNELIAQKKKLIWVRSQVTARLKNEWQEKFNREGPDALCPDIWMEYFNQQKGSVQRMSTWDYVSVSTGFYESYYVRLRRELTLLRQRNF